MKTTTAMIVVAALSFSGTAFSAEEAKGRIQTPAAKPAAPASAMPPPAVQESQPGAKPSVSAQPAKAKPARPKDLDLRHCLDLKTDAEIAKCAGE